VGLYPGVGEYMIYFELAVIVALVLFMFYYFWLYLNATGRITSGTDESFELEQERRAGEGDL